MKNASPTSRQSAGKILVFLLVLLALFALAVADCFRMDADGRALRDALKRGSGASFSRVFQGGVGPVLLMATRLGLRFVDDLPPEARRAATSVRAARVSVDQIEGRVRPEQYPEMIQEADRAMAKRGWERLACVRESETLVMVYIDPGARRGSTVQTRVAVLESDHLVVVSAKLRLQPLIDLGIDTMNHELAGNHGHQSGWLLESTGLPWSVVRHPRLRARAHSKTWRIPPDMGRFPDLAGHGIAPPPRSRPDPSLPRRHTGGGTGPEPGIAAVKSRLLPVSCPGQSA